MAIKRPKNAAAVAMAKRRWKGTTKEQRSQHATMMVREREAQRHSRRMDEVYIQGALQDAGLQN